MKSQDEGAESERPVQRSFGDRPMETQDQTRFGYAQPQLMQQQGGGAKRPVKS